MNSTKNIQCRYVLVQSTFWLSSCIILGFSSFYLVNNGYSEMQLGYVLATGNILGIALQSVMGSIADKYINLKLKHISAFYACIAILCASVLPFLKAPTPLFIILYTVIILVCNIQVSFLNALSTEHINNGTPLNYGLARGMGSMFFATISIFLGRALRHFGVGIAMPIYIGLSFLFVVAVFTFPSPIKIKADNLTEDKNALTIKEFIVQHPRFILTVVALLLVYSSHAFISSFLYQVVNDVGGDSSGLGIALAIGAYVELIGMLLYPIVLKFCKSTRKVLLLASLFFAIKTTLIFLARSPFEIYLAQGVQMFSFALFIPAQVYFVAETIDKHNQIKGQMFMGTANTMAVVINTLLGGYLIQNINVKNALLLMIVLNVIGLVMLLVVMPNSKKKLHKI